MKVNAKMHDSYGMTHTVSELEMEIFKEKTLLVKRLQPEKEVINSLGSHSGLKQQNLFLYL